MERLLSQLMNQFLRRFMGQAINKGIDHVATGGKTKAEQTPEDRARAQSGKEMAKRARQVQQILRRLR